MLCNEFLTHPFRERQTGQIMACHRRYPGGSGLCMRTLQHKMILKVNQCFKVQMEICCHLWCQLNVWASTVTYRNKSTGVVKTVWLKLLNCTTWMNYCIFCYIVFCLFVFISMPYNLEHFISGFNISDCAIVNVLLCLICSSVWLRGFLRDNNKAGS